MAIAKNLGGNGPLQPSSQPYLRDKMGPMVGILGGTNQGGNPGGINITPIEFPQRVRFTDVLPSVRSALGTAPQLGTVAALPGLDDSYFDSLYNDSRNRIQREFFDKGGLQEKLTENLNSRGLLGSSLETNANSQLNKTFGEQLAMLAGDIGRTKAEQNFQNASETRKLQQERDIKNAEFQNLFKELGLRSSLTEAAEANKYGIGAFEQQVKLQEIERDQQEKRRQQILDLLTSPNVALSSDQQDNILNSIFPGIGSNQPNKPMVKRSGFQPFSSGLGGRTLGGYV